MFNTFKHSGELGLQNTNFPISFHSLLNINAFLLSLKLFSTSEHESYFAALSCTSSIYYHMLQSYFCQYLPALQFSPKPPDYLKEPTFFSQLHPHFYQPTSLAKNFSCVHINWEFWFTSVLWTNVTFLHKLTYTSTLPLLPFLLCLKESQWIAQVDV